MTLALICSRLLLLCLLKHKTIISSIPIYYAKYHNVNKCPLLKSYFLLMNNIILTISGCFETSRRLV